MNFIVTLQWPAMLVTVVAALDGSLAKEAQEELGILAISLEQCAVDYLGTARRSACAYYFAALSRLLEY